jgi:uncharacterized membrane protein YfcA
MKIASNVLWGALILVFGVTAYALEHFLVPLLGKVWCEWLTGVMLIVLVLLYWWSGDKEKDERERQLRQEADSISLYVIILGLLAISIFERDMDMDGVFWLVLALAVVGRVCAVFYRWYQDKQ